MLKAVDTPNAPRPLSNYAQAIEVSPSSRIVHVSGQVGATLAGEIPEDVTRQHELAWENALAVLAAAGMDHRNIVDAHVYITDPGHLAIYRGVRDRILKGHRPAATLLVVAALADPRLVVEVDLVAAAPAT